jgi:NAD(P)-dependent dehydrogenase (short-subunit alcohol dehydrogenase family)
VRGLAGKVAIVAGGATGIGAATAARLAEEGSRVIVADVNIDGAHATVDRIGAAGGEALALPFDIAEPDSVDALVATTVARYGRVDLLHNVAADMSVRGLLGDSDALTIDLAVWERTLTVDLRGFLLTIRAVVPHLVAAGGGAIVNTSSAAAFVGEAVRPAYAAAKSGINALTRHVASAWGKQGVRCNSVAPGLVLTETVRASPDGRRLEEQLLPQVRSTRLGQPEDIAAMVAFLLSDDAAWINGQVVLVDGGTVLT